MARRLRTAVVVQALAAGALMPLAFAPFGLWPAVIVGLALSFWVIRHTSDWRQGFLRGWLIGVGKYAVGASWIYVSIHEQGGASESLAGVLVGVFVAGMALFSGLFGALYGAANRATRTQSTVGWRQVLLFAATWILAEWMLTWLLTGFPWLFVGYGLMPTWLVGFAPVIGVLGLGFLACLLAAGAVLLIGAGPMPAAQTKLSQRIAVVALWLIALGGGFALQQVQWVQLGEAREVALVQGNIEQISKWDFANRMPIINVYESLSEPHWDADLIIWPEAAITLFADEARPWLERWQARGELTATTLVLGLPDVARSETQTQTETPAGFQNTARALGGGSGRYIKQRLVPFGEYVPMEGLLRGAIQFFDLPMSRSVGGASGQSPLTADGTTLGLAICYEIAYPELVRRSAAVADVLVTISNDSWFGASIGPHQHLQIASMRALENGRFVLRGTNNGVTAIIDERGTIQASLPQFEPSVLRGVYHAASGRTPFNRVGHWPVVLLAGALLISIFSRKPGGKLPPA